MPAKSVNVNYNSNQTPPISFAPNNGNVEMDAAGTITFSHDPNFTYTNFVATAVGSSTPSTDFTFTVNTAGEMVVSDNDADAGTYNYCVTISVNGTPVSSDPQIINKQ